VLRTHEIKTFLEWHNCIFLKHERSSYQPILKKKTFIKDFFMKHYIHFKGAMLWWVPHFLVKAGKKLELSILSHLLSYPKINQRYYRKENKVLHSVTVLGHFSTAQEFNLKKLDQFFKVTIHFPLGHWKSTYSWGIIADRTILNNAELLFLMFSFLYVNVF